MSSFQLNPNVSLVPISEYCPKQQSILSQLEFEYLVHLMLNNESDKAEFNVFFVRQYKQYAKFLKPLKQYRQKISFALDILSTDEEGYRCVDKQTKELVCRLYSRRTTDCFLIDYWLFNNYEVCLLFDGNYYCKMEEDVFGINHQTVRMNGEHFCFESNFGGFNWVNPLIYEEIYYNGIKIKDYFQQHNIQDCEQKMLERMKQIK